jgi:hypothetical protein
MAVARPARDQLEEIWKNLQLLQRRLDAKRRGLPGYLIIGAQKCGTSSLHARLAEHPRVLPALVKEVHYFDRCPERALDWYRAHFPLQTKLEGATGHSGRAALTGEASPYYLFHPDCPARIHRALPDAKLIVLLRNPADRAYSHYQHVRRRGWEPLDFEAALDAEPGRLAAEAQARTTETVFQGAAHRRFSYTARGLYADQLARYLEYFPRTSLLVLESESYSREPARVYSEVLDFLGLEPFEPPRHDELHGFDYEGQPAHTRERLLEFFAPHNERLFALLGRRYDWSA